MDQPDRTGATTMQTIPETQRGKLTIHLVKAIADYADMPTPQSWATVTATLRLAGANDDETLQAFAHINRIVDAIHEKVTR
jgi:hypothetical protein